MGATAQLRRNLLVYGLGGFLTPFVLIKLIDRCTVLALALTTGVAYEANADESRYLIDPGRAQQYQDAFLTKSLKVVGLPGTPTISSFDAAMAPAVNDAQAGKVISAGSSGLSSTTSHSLAGLPRPPRGPDHVLRLPPDDGDAVEAVDIAQQACKEHGSPERKIDLGFVLDVKDDGDARGFHFIFSLGRGLRNSRTAPEGRVCASGVLAGQLSGRMATTRRSPNHTVRRWWPGKRTT